MDKSAIDTGKEGKRHERGKLAVEILKALGIAIALTLLLTIIEALLIKAFSIPDFAMLIITQVIKAVSLLTGALIAFRTPENGWRKGIILGLSYVVLAFLIFSLLAGEISFGFGLIFDIVLGAAMGLICGIIAVNVRSK